MSQLREQPLRRRVGRQDPPAISTARHFCIREIGVLAEQGVLDRARMLLARRAQRDPRDADAYLDAIRLEHGVPSSGSAWRAWLVRALEGGVEIADRVGAIVPEPALADALIEVPPGALLRLGDRASALELLRSRARALLAGDDPRALDLAEQLERTDAEDGELRELCSALLAARAFAEPVRVEQLAERLHIATTAEPLHSALALARDYRALRLEAELPAPLERVIGLWGRCDERTDQGLLSRLDRDLRAQPSVYLAWADALASQAPALIERLRARWQAACEPAPAGDSTAAEKVVAQARAAIEHDARRLVPLPTIERSLYRAHVRPRALHAVVAQAPELQATALVELASRQPGRARRVLRMLASDSALALIDQLARLCRSHVPGAT